MFSHLIYVFMRLILSFVSKLFFIFPQMLNFSTFFLTPNSLLFILFSLMSIYNYLLISNSQYRNSFEVNLSAYLFQSIFARFISLSDRFKRVFLKFVAEAPNFILIVFMIFLHTILLFISDILRFRITFPGILSLQCEFHHTFSAIY